MDLRATWTLYTCEGIPLHLRPAGLGPRLAAVAIDGLLQLLALGGLLLIAGTAAQRLGALGAGPLDPFPLVSSGIAAGATLAGLAMIWGYPTLFEIAWGGQTPGKRALGLQVIAADGGEVGWQASLVRNLLRPVDLLPGPGGLGALVVLLDPAGRRIGDIAAGTLVIRLPAPPPRPDLTAAAPDRLPPTWTPRRIRSALGPALLNLTAEALARAPRMQDAARARLLHRIASLIRARLDDDEGHLSDPTLLASILVRARADQPRFTTDARG